MPATIKMPATVPTTMPMMPLAILRPNALPSVSRRLKLSSIVVPGSHVGTVFSTERTGGSGLRALASCCSHTMFQAGYSNVAGGCVVVALLDAVLLLPLVLSLELSLLLSLLLPLVLMPVLVLPLVEVV